jgi:hypothetical protein
MGETTIISQSVINALTSPMTLTQNTGFSQDLVIPNNVYFIVGSNNITIDGNDYSVTINGVTGYNGLIKNEGFSNVTVKNIHIEAENGSSLTDGGGWIGQAYFGANASNNMFENCSNTAAVSTGSGGITGQYSGSNGGNVTVIKCSNSGTIDRDGGGIFGMRCGSSNGYITATDCCNSGKIEGPDAGGIIGNSCGWSNGHVMIERCYNTGPINGAKCGGIATNVVTQMTSFEIKNCYNSGTIQNSTSAGILGYVRADAVVNINLNCCYSVAPNPDYGIVGEVSTQYNSQLLNQVGCATTTSWEDSPAKSTLLGAPTTIPGTGTYWRSDRSNTPFYLVGSTPSAPTLSASGASITATTYSAINFFLWSIDKDNWQLFGSSSVSTYTFTGLPVGELPVGENNIYIKFVVYNDAPSIYASISIQVAASPTPSVPCFLKGTRVLTSKRGYVSVEKLGRSDILLNNLGKKMNVLDVSMFVCDKNQNTHPYLIPKGTKLDSEYKCTDDLYVSPRHEILIGNKFMAVQDLGDRFKQTELDYGAYEYYHITTDNYFTDVIMANGIPSEGFGMHMCMNMDAQFISRLMKYTHGNDGKSRKLLSTAKFMRLLGEFRATTPLTHALQIRKGVNAGKS